MSLLMNFTEYLKNNNASESFPKKLKRKVYLQI